MLVVGADWTPPFIPPFGSLHLLALCACPLLSLQQTMAAPKPMLDACVQAFKHQGTAACGLPLSPTDPHKVSCVQLHSVQKA